MELLYIWIEEYRNIKRQGFNFSSEYRFDFDYEMDKETNEVIGGTLKIEDNPNYIPNFFGKGISNVTAIVGENGSGKSSLLDLLDKPDTIFLICEKEDSKIFVSRNINVKTFCTKNNIQIQIEKKNNNDVTDIIYYSPFIQEYAKSESVVEKRFDISTSNLLGQKKYYHSDSLNSYFSYQRNFQFLSSLDKDFSFLPSEIYLIPRFMERGKDLNPNIKSKITLSIYNRSEEEQLFLIKKLYKSNIKNKQKIHYLILENQIFWTVFYRIMFPLTETTTSFALFIGSELSTIKHFWNIKPPSEDYLIENWFFEEVNRLKTMSMKDINPRASIFFDMILKTLDIVFELISKNKDGIIYIPAKENDDVMNQRILIKLNINENKKNLTDYLEVMNDFKIIHSVNYMSEVFSFYFRSISSGEDAYINLFTRFNMLKNRLEGGYDIILLLDEGESGFHPQWQKQYLKFLIDFLPKIFCYDENGKYNGRKLQIILTSHSPFVVSDLPKDNVIFLKKDNEGNCQVADGLHEMKDTFGANIHTLLSDSFFMEGGLIGEFAQEKINKLIDYLNHGENELIQDEETAQKYINIIGEPILKRQLQKILDSKRLQKVEDVEDKVNQLEKTIELLRQEVDKLKQKS